MCRIFRRMHLNCQVINDLSMKVRNILLAKANEAIMKYTPTVKSEAKEVLRLSTLQEESEDLKVKFELDSPSDSHNMELAAPFKSANSREGKKRRSKVKVELIQEEVIGVQDTKISSPPCKGKKRRRQSNEIMSPQEPAPSVKRKRK